jgi:dTDP-4-dehydrorhamnose 3,5-epimerase-like enzyme
MNIEQKKINFEDERGTITDIFVNDPMDHCTIIFTKKGGVRGNHYHKLSEQQDFLISGKFEVYSQKMGVEEISKNIWNPYELVTWEASEAHEFIALEDSLWVTFVKGLRGGDNFEKDTYRLETPLHEEFGGKINL